MLARIAVTFVAAAIFTTSALAAQGPQSPEFASFSPAAERSEPIDLFTGDFRYQVPVVGIPVSGNDIFPVALAYQAGISPDAEASWAGLGWSLNPGSINRQMRGLPDDYKGDADCSSLNSGDCIATTEDIEPNWTFGLGLDGNLELIGADTGLGLGLSAGLKGYYNSYRGLGYARSIGLSGQTSSNGIAASVGLNLSNDSQQGFRASPSLSLADTLSVNATYDAVAGLSAFNMTTKYRDQLLVEADLLNFAGYARPAQLPGPGRDMTGWNLQVSVKGGGEIQGVYANLQASGFYNVEQVKDPDERYNRAVGYLHLEQALNAASDVRDRMVLDFNRERDGPIYDDSPNLAIPVIANDLYSLSAPGLGGTFRAYRNDVPWLYDVRQTTELMGGALGFDIGGGLIAKFGLSGSVNGTKGVNGGWDGGDGGALVDALKAAVPATPPADFERTYFKLIGERTPRAPGAALPGDDAPVAIPIKPAPFDITDLPPAYFEAEANLTTDGQARLPLTIDGSKRAVRATLIEPFTNAQLDGNGAAFPEFAISRGQIYAGRRSGHIGGFRVTNTEGTRFVYAIPVYNTAHEEHHFSVKRENFVDGSLCSLVLPPIAGGRYDYQVDHSEKYLHVKKLSPHAISWLLTAVLGPDYIDADGTPGPSEGDYGYWVRLDYAKEPGAFAWRRPVKGAQFVRGLDNGPFMDGSPRRADRASFSYGEREEWYLATIHTRTHLARFHRGQRQDSFAASAAVQNGNAAGRAAKRLERVELYARDLMRPMSEWQPLQTVHLDFDYSLQRGAPGLSAGSGKLTLRKVRTVFERNARGQTSPYEFDYEAGDSANNPSYVANSADRWGTFQSTGTTLSTTQCEQAGVANDPTLRAGGPYVDQSRAIADRNRQAAAWSLRRIVEPSGREVSIAYEADDYRQVQDRDATVMTRIVAVNHPDSSTPSIIDRRSNTDPQARDALRVYFAAPSGLDAQAVRDQLVGSSGRMHFRIRIALKDGITVPNEGAWETVSGYATVADGGTLTAADGRSLAWLELDRVQGFHPFSIAAWQHLRLIQPDITSTSAINGDPSADPFAEAFKFLTLADFVTEIVDMIRGIYPTWFDRKWGQAVDLQSSYLRLRVPSGIKYGGGLRVARISYRDRWSDATGSVEPDLVTGFRYEYRTPGGTSSGVASYEPSGGAEENAVRDALPFTQKVLLASSYKLFAETPVAESYFPAPNVGYSRVVVRTIASEDARERARQGQIPTRTSTLGPVVHEFYTAADFPVVTAETPIVKRRNPQPWIVPIPFLGQITLNSMAATQGYAIALNDMHGKPRRTSRYEYGRAWDPATQDFQLRAQPDESTEYFYRASGGAGGTAFTLDPQVPVITEDGTSAPTNTVFGREAELFVDTRRNRTESFDAGLNVNVDLTYAIFPIPLIVPMPSLAYSLSEAKTAVAMKVVHQSGALDRVVTRTGPSERWRRDHAFDAFNGRTLLTSETNDFDDPVYEYRLPARWRYTRMGPAYASSALRLPLAGATLVGNDVVVVPSPAIPACDDATARSGLCLPIGSRFAVGQGASARSLVLESATANDLTLRSTSSLTTVPGGDAVLVASGDANQLELDAGHISALSDPRTGRTSARCAWTTTEVCGVCYVKERVVTPSCLADTLVAALGGEAAQDDRKCATLQTRGAAAAAGSHGMAVIDKSTRVARTCRTVLIDDRGNEVDPQQVDAAGPPQTGAAAPVDQAASLSYSGISFKARAAGQPVVLFVYSDCDGWVDESSRSKPLFDYCDKGHERTNVRVKDVLSATATLFADSWPSVAEEVRFPGTKDEITASSTSYAARGAFARGERGIWRAARQYEFVENRRQSAAVDLRRDGAFDLTMFDWSDPDNAICAPQWRWHSQVTRYAPSGVEIEELDPAGLASAALYGHVQRVPIAMARNAGHDEVATESFEAFEAGKSVDDVQTGEGNIRFHTVTTRERITRVCPNDLIVNAELDGTILRVADDRTVRAGGTSRDHAILDDAKLASGTLLAEIPGISCPIPLTGGGRGPDGRIALVLDPSTTPCNLPPPRAEPGLATRLDGIRLIQACHTISTQYVPVRKISVSATKAHTGKTSLAVASHHDFHQPDLALVPGKRYLLSSWVSRDNADVATYRDVDTLGVQAKFWAGSQELAGSRPALIRPEGPVIDGWQRMQGTFEFPAGADGVSFAMQNGEDRGAPRAYFDDLRLVPEDGRLETYVYDPAKLRVVAQLDTENYARVFSYHADGTLAQTQQETEAGKLTVEESRMHSAERP